MELIRLSVSEAAKFFGISGRTVRRALEDKDLEYILVQGRYKISLTSLLAWSKKTPTVRKKLQAKGVGQFVKEWL
jgi:excisionase family DNA binding protein